MDQGKIEGRDDVLVFTSDAPDKPVEVTGHLFAKVFISSSADDTDLSLTSSSYPRFDLNPGTGKAWSDDGEKVKQTNRIHCDAEHPSRIIVPVVE